jgi:hypothetical protein
MTEEIVSKRWYFESLDLAFLNGFVRRGDQAHVTVKHEPGCPKGEKCECIPLLLIERRDKQRIAVTYDRIVVLTDDRLQTGTGQRVVLPGFMG